MIDESPWLRRIMEAFQSYRECNPHVQIEMYTPGSIVLIEERKPKEKEFLGSVCVKAMPSQFGAEKALIVLFSVDVVYLSSDSDQSVERCSSTQLYSFPMQIKEAITKISNLLVFLKENMGIDLDEQKVITDLDTSRYFRLAVTYPYKELDIRRERWVLSQQSRSGAHTERDGDSLSL